MGISQHDGMEGACFSTSGWRKRRVSVLLVDSGGMSQYPWVEEKACLSTPGWRKGRVSKYSWVDEGADLSTPGWRRGRVSILLDG